MQVYFVILFMNIHIICSRWKLRAQSLELGNEILHTLVIRVKPLKAYNKLVRTFIAYVGNEVSACIFPIIAADRTAN